MPTEFFQTTLQRIPSSRVPRLALEGLLWVVLGVVFVGALRVGTTTLLLAATFGAVLLTALWARPRIALTVWLISFVSLPVWIGVDFVTAIDAQCIIGIVAIIATFNRAPITFNKFDAYVALVVGLAFLAVLFGDSPVDLWRQILVRWVVPYAAARVLVSATGARFAVNVLAVVLGIAGAVAILELALTWHPYVNWDNGTADFLAWHSIQARNGIDRSEGAFGHSIALGGALAISIPFIARSSHTRIVKLILSACVIGGILSTQSRGALIAAAVSGTLCLLYIPKSQISRIFFMAASALAVIAASIYIGPLLEQWLRGESNEAQSSFDYRGQLYSNLLQGIAWIGKSPVYLTGGSRGFQSTDSAFLAIGLRFGWIVLAALIIPLLIATVRVLLGRATVGEIAIVGQIPLFATVALITQYESVVFLVAGVAVQMVIEQRRNASEARSTLNPAHTTPLSRSHSVGVALKE